MDINKEPLLLLPGLLCNKTAWAPQVSYFSNERDVIVADYGEANTLKAMAQKALDQAPEKFALAGHSMGARVALELIQLAPECVTRIALLDTGVHPLQPGETEKRYGLRDVGKSKGMNKLVDLWLPPMVHPDQKSNETLMKPLRDMAISFGVEGFSRQIEALITRRDATPLLKEVSCPVLVAVGEQDAWSPPSQHEAIVAEIPQAVYQVFPNTGHMAPVESPILVNKALADWLK